MSNAKAPIRAEQTKADSRKYRAPELVEVGASRDLIRGPMLHEYWDCIGNGKTLTRPNC